MPMKTRNRRLFMALAAFGLAVLLPWLHAAVQAPKSMPLPGIPIALREAMLRGDTDAALAALERGLAEAPAADADTPLFLRAHTLAQAGRRVEALAALDEIGRRKPDSIWRWKAAFLRAELLRQERRFEEAAAIYREQLERLSGAARQGELAALYLRFADELLAAPVAPNQQPPYARAAELCRLASELEGPAEQREGAFLRWARGLDALSNPSGAATAYEAYLAEFDSPGPGEDATGGPANVFGARLALAKARAASGAGAQARRLFEDLSVDLRRAAAGEGPHAKAVRALGGDALRKLLELDGEAQASIPATYMGESNGEQKVAAALERFLERFGDHPRAAAARLELAKRLAALGRGEEAIALFDRLLAQDPKSDEQLARGQADALFAKATTLGDLRRHAEERVQLTAYIARYPSGEHWNRCQQLLLDSEIAEADTHFAREEFDAARAALEQFVARHPLDARAPELWAKQAQCQLEFADLPTTDAATAKARRLSAIELWRALIAKYPSSSQATDARWSIGSLFEQELNDPEAAIAAYRACEGTPSEAEGRAALERLTRPALQLSVERSSLASEACRALARVRNIESLHVELWRLDLETYFRKNLGHGGVEHLDLDLIQPESEFDLPVAGYAAHREFEQSLELSIAGPGAWVIVVGAGDLRASALCLRSDLDVIVKSTADEALVFAQDMALGRPAAEVRVIAALPPQDARGEPRIFEVRTDTNGFARLPFAPRAEGGALRVLAERGGHCASTSLDFAVRPTEALGARALIYTDRPAYRPGETVHWRAIHRGAKDGRFVVTPAATLEVSWSDPRGRAIRTRVETLSEFGTLHGSFDLPPESPLGTWTVGVRLDGQIVQAPFEVEPFELLHLEFSGRFERPVYRRGETAVAVFETRHAHGAPLSNATIEVRFPDQRLQRLRTDATGIARVEVPTRDFDERMALELDARLVDEPLEATARTFVSASEFQLRLSTARNEYGVGDPFTLELSKLSPLGEPTSGEDATFQLELLRLEHRPGRVEQEVSVARQTVKLGADGRLRLPYTVDRAGPHRLRVRAVDRFDNPVEAQRDIEILPVKDDTLRWIADLDECRAGDVVKLAALEGGAGGLALVTFENARVIDWRWIQLEKGKNPLEFAVADGLFPAFEVAIAHQRRGSFREARVDFRVRRDWTMTLKPSAEVIAPGDEGAIDVELRDVLGRPVRAEFSLAIVDAALLTRYPARRLDLDGAFVPPPPPRGPRVHSESSANFSYDGSTWEVASEVLAEARRVEEDRKWTDERNKARQLAGRDSFERASEEAELLRGAPGAPAAENASKAKATGGLDMGGFGGGQFGGRVAQGTGSSRPQLGLPRESSTAYWSATLVTDAQGKARVRFPAPADSARWSVQARAAGSDAMTTQAVTEFVTRAEFFVEVRAPAALVEGDRPRFQARLHNTTSAALRVDGALSLEGAGVKTQLPLAALTLEPGSTEVEFAALEQAFAPGECRLEIALNASGGGKQLSARDTHSMAVAPWGVEFDSGRSGDLTTTIEFDLELPRGRKYSNGRLELFVGQGLDAALIDEALGLDAQFLRRSHGGATALPDDPGGRAIELFGHAEVLLQMREHRRDADARFARLRERVEAQCAVLAILQTDDGRWSGRWDRANQETDQTAWALIALAHARKAGVTVDETIFERGRGALAKQLRSAQDEERKALAHHALSRIGAGDYGALNRLHRMRAELSTGALAHTALALTAQDRLPMAAEVAAEIEARAEFDPARPDLGASWDPKRNLAWSRSRVSTTALCVLALHEANPSSPALPRGIQALSIQRTGCVPRSAGLTLAALARHAGTWAVSQERCGVTASIDGGAPVALDVGAARSFALDAASKVRVRLELSGRGRPHFTAELRGFSTDVAQTDDGRRRLLDRRVLAPLPLWKGRALPVGFQIVRQPLETWQNEIRQLPRGATATSQVQFSRADAVEGEADWLLLEVPLPAGVRVRRASLQGTFAFAEVLPGRLIAHIPPDAGSAALYFEMEGVAPGRYRVAPAVLRSASSYSQATIGKASDFEVLAADQRGQDPYRRTPDELFALGKAAIADGEKQAGREALEQLMAEFQERLHDQNTNSPLQEAASALFFLAIERADAREIVRWFEVLREKRPEQYIPFDKIVAVADGYTRIGEHERALSILRANVDEVFGLDLKVAGALESAGDPSAACTTLARLCNEYPDAPLVLQSWLAISDKLLAQAPDAARSQSFVRDQRSRAALHLEGTRLLQWFLCLHPRDPAAPEAALNLIAAHVGLEDYEVASSLAQSFAARFDQPEFVDAFLHSQAVAEWYLGRDEKALALCERIATVVYKDASGVEHSSKNRDLARYILAQIHHARRDVTKAAEYYRLVESSFADAREALARIEARSLALPEVTHAKAGEKVAVSLRAKRVGAVDLSVYPVDLMTLYLREGDLSKVAQVELSGISALISERRELNGADSLREVEHRLDLSFEKDGAYLVIARGADLFASGLVLVSHLELDIVEEVETGAVRVQVIDGRDGRYVRDADVRVVGSEDRRIQRAKSDLRGVASIAGVRGSATVIARASGERYAFHRGQQRLGPADARGRTSGRARLEQQGAAENPANDPGYFSNVADFNGQNRAQRFDRLDQAIQAERKGLQINQVK